MSEELTPEQIAHRGRMTAAFLASDAWEEAQERLDREAWLAFKRPQSTPPDREALWTQVRAFEEVYRVLRAIRDRANLESE